MYKNFQSTSGQSASPPTPRAPPVLGVKRTQTCRSLPGNRENRENLLKERWRGRGTATERRREKGGRKEEVINGTEGGVGIKGREGEWVRQLETELCPDWGRQDHGKKRHREILSQEHNTLDSDGEFFRCDDCSRYWTASEGLIDKMFWWNGRVRTKGRRLRNDASLSLYRVDETQNKKKEKRSLKSLSILGQGTIHIIHIPI